jgi:hypothetical protein
VPDNKEDESIEDQYKVIFTKKKEGATIAFNS